jgi:hypothetical protein
MKKAILILGIMSLASCLKVKDWKCTTTVNGNVVGNTTFTGTKEEMEKYESYHVVLGNVYENTCK